MVGPNDRADDVDSDWRHGDVCDRWSLAPGLRLELISRGNASRKEIEIPRDSHPNCAANRLSKQVFTLGDRNETRTSTSPRFDPFGIDDRLDHSCWLDGYRGTTIAWNAKKADIRTAQAQIGILASALKMYAVDMRTFR